MLAMSIEDGALYQWFDPDTGQGDTEAMLDLLKDFWHAVAETFPDAWDVSPRRSRLVHGVGIVALGCLMDEISYELRARRRAERTSVRGAPATRRGRLRLDERDLEL